MNRIIPLLLCLSILLTATACGGEGHGETESSADSSAIEASPVAATAQHGAPHAEPSESSESSEAPEEQVLPIDATVEKYYTYFGDSLGLLLEEPGYTLGFSDEEVSAYVIYKISKDNPSYDAQKGITKQDFDAMTQQYFGKTVFHYNNQKVSMQQGGNIISTGWDYAPSHLIIKAMADLDSGAKRVIAYQVPHSSGQLSEEEYRQKVLTGKFEGLGDIWLVELQFFEKTDSQGNVYLMYLSANRLGRVIAPFQLYKTP